MQRSSSAPGGLLVVRLDRGGGYGTSMLGSSPSISRHFAVMFVYLPWEWYRLTRS